MEKFPCSQLLYKSFPGSFLNVFLVLMYTFLHCISSSTALVLYVCECLLVFECMKG